MILEFDATKESEEALVDATKSRGDTQKAAMLKKKISRIKKCGL